MPSRPVKLRPTDPRVKWSLVVAIGVGGLVLAATWYQTIRQFTQTDFSGVEQAVEQAADVMYEQYQEKQSQLDEHRQEFSASVDVLKTELEAQEQQEHINQEQEEKQAP